MAQQVLWNAAFDMDKHGSMEYLCDESTRHRMRILTYNIQGGIYTQRYREYITNSWKQILPHKERLHNLNRIATMLSGYDLVGLQEVDSGSLRTGFVDQTEYLAHRAGFPWWYKQINRNMGLIAQHSNGVLGKTRPVAVTEHRLPGLPGRGALLLEFGEEKGNLAICIVHLALGRRSRAMQLDYIRELVSDYSRLVVMGDMNCGTETLEVRRLMKAAHLQEPVSEMKTFPSWRPQRKIDHILVSEDLSVRDAHVLNYPLSDHLPVSLEICWPPNIDNDAA